MKILIVGAGNMGATYAESFLLSHSITKDDLLILEKTTEKADFLREKGYKNVISVANESISKVQLIILAVKPQDTKALFETLKSYILPSQTVLSIMAGVKIETLKTHLGTSKIIRAMPNLPSQIGMGMTGFTADDSVSRDELFFVQNLLNTTGKTLYFSEESKIDAVTAISGSGPAYVYFFMEAMIKEAQKMGFSHSEAELLVTQTFMGAVHLENRSTYSCEEWIKRVSSKGGTTEAALNVFSKEELADKIGQGLAAAEKRATELGE
jgi:pyrroline-5-carboxylate reductase